MRQLAGLKFDLSLFNNPSYCVKQVESPCVHFLSPKFQFGFECSNLKSSCYFSLKWEIEFVEQVKHVTQVSKYWDPMLKYSASGDPFSRRNPCKPTFNSKTLISDLLLESHLTSVYKRRCLCSASVSSQGWSNRCALRIRTLMWLIMLIISCKKLLSSDDSFRITCISLWMVQCEGSNPKATSLIRIFRPENRPVIAAGPFMHTPIQNNQLSL